MEIKLVNLDLVGRTGMYMERCGMNAERKVVESIFSSVLKFYGTVFRRHLTGLLTIVTT